MDNQNEEIKYQMFPNENNALTKEAAKDVGKIVAQIEKEVNDIIEDNYEEKQSKTK